MLATVDQIKTQKFPEFADARGALVPIESFPFPVVRIFYIHDVPVGVERGGHGHKRCQQFLVCQMGAMQFKIFDGRNARTFDLTRGQGVVLPVGIYSTMTPTEPGTVLLALCDMPYEAQDYLHSVEEVKRFRAGEP